MISDFEFEDGKQLLRNALPAARNIRRLKERARAARIPTIYVNDNFGQWRSDFRQLVHRCLNEAVRGEPITRLLMPDEQDYFVLKPANSGFFDATADSAAVNRGRGDRVDRCVEPSMCPVYRRRRLRS